MNIDNTTDYETEADFERALVEADEDVLGEPSVTPTGATDGATNGGSGTAASDAAVAIDGANSKSAQKMRALDYRSYCAFWSLQERFQQPSKAVMNQIE